MKLLPLTLFILTLTPSRGDIILTAPGVPVGSQIVNEVPFRRTFQLTDSYKFVFNGIEAKGNTTIQSTQSNGSLILLKAFVSDNQLSTPTQNAIQLIFKGVSSFNTSPNQTMVLTPGQTFEAITNPITINIVWQGEGNGLKPNGTFSILGEYQKDPPPPIGTLNFIVGDWLLRQSNPQPVGTTSIVR